MHEPIHSQGHAGSRILKRGGVTGPVHSDGEQYAPSCANLKNANDFKSEGGRDSPWPGIWPC